MRKDNDELTAATVVRFIFEWMAVTIGPLILVVSLWRYLPNWPRFVSGILGSLAFGICFVLMDWIRDLINKIVTWLKSIRS